MIRKELINRHGIGFPADQHYAEDILFYMKCFLHSKKLSCVKEELFMYRIHQQSALQNCGTIKLFGTISCFSKLKKELKVEDKKIKKLIDNYSIPSAIINVLIYWIISTNNDTLYKRLLRFKTIRIYMLKGILHGFVSYARFKMAIKLMIILLIPNLYYSHYKIKKHDYID